MTPFQRITLLGLVLLAFFAGLHLAPLADVDEGAFSEATREMLESGNYISTTLNGAPRFDKPILIYWCQAASVSLFGLSEFALRLPSALAGSLWVLMTFWLVRRFIDTQKAWLACVLMTTALQITIICKSAIADSLLNCCLMGAMTCIFLASETQKKLPLYGAFACMGLGMLAKGPIAVLIPLAVSGLYLRFNGFFFRSVFNPIGILIFLAVCGPWYLLEYQARGQAFIDGFIFRHNLSRLTDSVSSHEGPFYYYIPVVLFGIMPHTPLFFKFASQWRLILQSPLNRFCTVWFGFVFVFFSLATTKLPHYIILGYTPLFILLSQVEVTKRFLLLSYTAFSLTLCLLAFLAPQIITLAGYLVDKPAFTSLVPELVAHFSGAFQWQVLGFAALFLALLALHRMPRLLWLSASATACVLLVNGVLASHVISFMQNPVKEAGLFAKQHQLAVSSYLCNKPSFSVYAERATPVFIPGNTPAAGQILLTEERRLAQLPPHEILYNNTYICLIRIKDSL